VKPHLLACHENIMPMHMNREMKESLPVLGQHPVFVRTLHKRVQEFLRLFIHRGVQADCNGLPSAHIELMGIKEWLDFFYDL
jgi:hypothetical protein